MKYKSFAIVIVSVLASVIVSVGSTFTLVKQDKANQKAETVYVEITPTVTVTPTSTVVPSTTVVPSPVVTATPLIRKK